VTADKSTIRVIPVIKKNVPVVEKMHIRTALNVLKYSAGEGWRRSVGPIVWKVKKYYTG
jgi:hypothetical protein